MGSDLNGLSRAAGERLNQFALVNYLPDPLARFLDDLRRELVVECVPRAHLTVLPPRPLRDVDAAQRQLQAMVPDFAPFTIELDDVAVFRGTNVIYIEVGRGAAELRSMHGALNREALYFGEPFEYHPHVTLAQDFDPGELPRLEALARARWSGWRGPRACRADNLAFVQNTISRCWIDLAELALGAVKV